MLPLYSFNYKDSITKKERYSTDYFINIATFILLFNNILSLLYLRFLLPKAVPTIAPQKITISEIQRIMLLLSPVFGVSACADVFAAVVFAAVVLIFAVLFQGF